MKRLNYFILRRRVSTCSELFFTQNSFEAISFQTLGAHVRYDVMCLKLRVNCNSVDLRWRYRTPWVLCVKYFTEKWNKNHCGLRWNITRAVLRCHQMSLEKFLQSYSWCFFLRSSMFSQTLKGSLTHFCIATSNIFYRLRIKLSLKGFWGLENV